MTNPLAAALPHLPLAVARVTMHELLGALPPLASADPEDHAARDEAAVAAVVALFPYDAFEARLAARIVAAAQAMECLRLASLAADDLAEAHRRRAQAATMMRQSQSALRTLRSDQAARDKGLAERHPGMMERCGYRFKEIKVPDYQQPDAFAQAQGDDLATEADQYALIYPRRARLIRGLRGLPEPCDFGPPRPELVAAIVNGTSRVLRELDVEEAAPAPA